MSECLCCMMGHVSFVHLYSYYWLGAKQKQEQWPFVLKRSVINSVLFLCFADTETICNLTV